MGKYWPAGSIVFMCVRYYRSIFAYRCTARSNTAVSVIIELANSVTSLFNRGLNRGNFKQLSAKLIMQIASNEMYNSIVH